MKNINKYRLSVVTILPIFFLLVHLSLNAATFVLDPILPTAPKSALPVSPIEHQQTIRSYINQLRFINNRIFNLVQLTLDTPSKNIPTLKQNINNINLEIDSIRLKMRDYLSAVQTTSIQKKDILLLFNALNHISNQLFYLEQLSLTPSHVEKVNLLEDFFRSRSATKDTLDAIEEFISEELIFN